MPWLERRESHVLWLSRQFRGMTSCGDGTGRRLPDDWKAWRLYPEKRAKEYGSPPKKLPRSPGHHIEWINACKGGPAAGSQFDWAGPMTETVLLGNVALRSQLREDLTHKKLLWDSSKFSFTNHDAANTFLRREYRKGWEV